MKKFIYLLLLFSFISFENIFAQDFEFVCNLPWSCITFDNNNLWSVFSDYTAYKMDIGTGQILETMPFNINPDPGWGVEGRGVTWDGNSFWYSEWGLDRIFQIDANNGTILKSFSSPGSGPQDLAWDGQNIWYTDEYSNNIYLLSSADGSVIKQISVPEINAYYSGIAYAEGCLWLSNYLTSYLYKVDINNGSILEKIYFPYGYPDKLAYNNGNLYIGNWNNVLGICQLYKLSIQTPEQIIAVNPRILYYGNVQVLTTTIKTLEVSNQGATDLEINSLNLFGQNSSEFSIEDFNFPMIIHPGEIKNIDVNFEPSECSLAQKEAILQITSNDENNSIIEVKLKGYCLPHSSLTYSILYESDFDGIYKIYKMLEDGSNRINLTDNTYDDNDPIWSSATQKIYYMSHAGTHYQIYNMDLDGINQTNISNSNFEDTKPDVSHDGTKIVFVSNRDGSWQVYTMDIDGSNQRCLTSFSNVGNHQPRWSPDDTKIVFLSERDGNYEVYIMNSDGSNQINLTNNPAEDWFPTWSIDGTKIMFVSNRNSDNSDIYLMNPDGTDVQKLFGTSGNDWEPMYSPDGNNIAFQSDFDGDFEICVINSDGTNLIKLTDNGCSDTSPTWLFESQNQKYKIYASAGNGGTIEPCGEIEVSWGTDKDFRISPNPGYFIYEVKVDGNIQPVSDSIYTFSNITSDHSISVSFDINSYYMKKSSLKFLSEYINDPDKKISNAFKKTKEKIEQSLEAELWKSINHLTSNGKKVFDYEKEAANELTVKILKHYSGNIYDAAMNTITNLLLADKKLAGVALEDAKNVCEDQLCQKEIESATKELNWAQEEIEKGKFDNAIDRFKKSWKHSQQALKKALAKTYDFDNKEMLTSYILNQNYPNPFNPVTLIKYSLPHASNVSLKVFDLLGKEVATLVNAEKEAGEYEVEFNATSLNSGTYIYRLEAGNIIVNKKMILLK